MKLVLIFLTSWWDVVAAAFMARPVLWSVMLAWVFGLMFCVWDGLDRRGARAVGWGLFAGVFFALWVALSPEGA